MNVLVFGDPVLAARTIRVIGGRWIDLETCEIAPQGTLFVQAGTVMVTPPAWEPSEAVFALGATYEDPAWQAYLKRDVAAKRPRPHAFFLSGAAIQILNTLRRKSSFWESLARLQVRTWIEPQLRNWFHPRLRVLQVVTSLHVGGAERVCVELSTMQECVGIVCWGQPKRTPLAKPLWDLSRHPTEKKPEALLEFARKLHVDLLHTHLLTAKENAELEKHYPLLTTIHNVKAGWPSGYERLKPGMLVACSKLVAADLGRATRVAWNGVTMKVTRRPKRKHPKSIALVAIANFRLQKRLDKLPSILKALRNLGYRPRLTVVGEVHPSDPTSREAHRRFWQKAKTSKVASLITETATLDVRRILARSDVFVSTSSFEGLSLSHLEALAAGLPAVVTDVGGAKEVQREVEGEGYSLLSPSATAKTFAREIVRVSALPRRNRLPKAFTAESMRQRYRWLYYACLARGRQGAEVWLITNNFTMGGAQTSARRLLVELSKKHPIRAFTLEEGKASAGAQALVEAGVPVENLDGSSAWHRARNLVTRCAAVKPRVIFFWNVMCREKLLISDALDLPMFDVSPGEMYFSEMERYLSRPEPEFPVRNPREYGRRLQGAVVKYSRERRRMREFLGIPVHVIPNGVTGIAPVKRTFARRMVFGTAARIAPHKRLEDILEAFAPIPAPVLIAGRVEAGANDYFEQLKASGSPNIRWVGEQDVRKFLPKLDVFVMVSEPAGCPNASLEAMASGLPIIATDVGGANEQVITGKNGWLVRPRNSKALRRAAEEALQLKPSELRKLACGSLKKVRSFSLKQMVQGYEGLFTIRGKGKT